MPPQNLIGLGLQAHQDHHVTRAIY